MKENSRVFMDISIGDEKVGRLQFELFIHGCPRTCENFRQLATGESRVGSYRGTPIHRVIKGFMFQGGDFENGNGTGGTSIYGGKFEDENFTHNHDDVGMLSMANRGPDTNGSQFFVIFAPQNHLNNVHVVFGRLRGKRSREVLRAIESVPTDSNDKPLTTVIISNCGELIKASRIPESSSVAEDEDVEVNVDLDTSQEEAEIEEPSVVDNNESSVAQVVTPPNTAEPEKKDEIKIEFDTKSSAQRSERANPIRNSNVLGRGAVRYHADTAKRNYDQRSSESARRKAKYRPRGRKVYRVRLPRDYFDREVDGCDRWTPYYG